MTDTRIEPYGLDPTFEAAVAALACIGGRFYGLVGHALDPEAMTIPAAKLAVKAAQACARDIGRGPASGLLVLQRLRRWSNEGKVRLEQVAEVADLLDDAQDAGLPAEDAAASEVAAVVSRRMQSDAVRAAITDYAKRGDFADVREMLTRADRLGKVDQSPGLLIGTESFSELEKLRMVERLPTGVGELDAAIGGGLPRGCLGMFIGETGAGKSIALSQVAGEAGLLGLHVCAATLELPEAMWAARLKSNLTDVPTNDLLGLDPVAIRLAQERIAALSDRLGIIHVKEFSPGVTTVEDLDGWLKTCEDRHGRQVDVLVVDYCDRLAAPHEKSDYTAMRVVYEGTRELMKGGQGRRGWAWTASQAKAAQKGKKFRDVSDASDSSWKGRVVDLAVTLNMEGDEDDRQMFMFVGKNRYGKRASVGPLPVDFERGRLVPRSGGAY